MKIDIVTLFPDMFRGPFDESMIKRAQEKKLVAIGIHNLRKWAIDSRGTVDGHPYGGGAGMLLRVEPVFKAVKQLRVTSYESDKNREKVILMDAGGKKLNQDRAFQFSKLEHLIIICGHYEGVDYRVHEMVDEVVSIGDFVMTGGELPAMMVTDAVVRLLPRVLNNIEGTEIESFGSQLSGIGNQKSVHNRKPTTESRKLVEFPQYTRPEEFMGKKVPEILLSGHHGEIGKWRHEQATLRTRKNRPDLLADGQA